MIEVERERVQAQAVQVRSIAFLRGAVWYACARRPGEFLSYFARYLLTFDPPPDLRRRGTILKSM